jgi:hypothetical protein
MRYSLRAILRDLDDGTGEGAPERAVTWILEHDKKLAALMLTPIVTSEWSRMQRVEHRTIEDEAYIDGDPFDESRQRAHVEDDLSERPALDIVARRRKLLESVFWSPLDDGYVRWGEANVHQHRARAKQQRALGQAVLEDAKRHESAARRIERVRGARTLNDVHDRLMALV